MLSREFLESKINAWLDYWKDNRAHAWERKCDDVRFIHHPTQVYETESGGIRFILWNLIGNFDGHYECVVNIDTFEYFIRQHSSFGSLTWTTPPKDMVIYSAKDLSNEQKLEIEASIAKTILWCFPIYESYYTINVVSKSSQLCLSQHVCSDDLSVLEL